MSGFSPDTFLQTEIEGQNDTKFHPVPVGEYRGKVVKLETKQAEVQGETKTIVTVHWEIDDDKAREATGMERPTARQEVWLDLNENNGLDMGKGKNVSLGKLREAVGLNNPGQSFSFAMLNGRGARVYVTHRPNAKTGDIYAEIKKVVAA